jgi:uncharacterized protein (TIGR00369 family)
MSTAPAPDGAAAPATDPTDPGARVAASFARQAAMTTLGAELVSVSHGRVEIAFDHRPALTQQHGFVHAGIVGTVLDSACGYAAFSCMPPEAAVLTVEYKLNLLAPARGPRLRCEGVVVKAGRTISVVEGRAWQRPASDHPDAPEQLVATMTATVMTVLGRGLSG